MLKFFDLSIFEFSSTLMFNIFKDINTNIFSKLIDNGIHSIITTLYSIFIILVFF